MNDFEVQQRLARMSSPEDASALRRDLLRADARGDELGDFGLAVMHSAVELESPDALFVELTSVGRASEATYVHVETDVWGVAGVSFIDRCFAGIGLIRGSSSEGAEFGGTEPREALA
jgi:hypothetical protein